MSEFDLKIEVRRMIRGDEHLNEKAVPSIVKALRLRHCDIDIKMAKSVTTSIMRESKCQY